MTPPDLEETRAAIEALDRRLLALLKERMTLSEAIARGKLDTATPFRDPIREDQVIERVRHLAVELKLDPHEIERLYRLIMEMSIARQQAFVHALETVPLRVAYQGIEGAFSHLAAQRRYGGRPGGALLLGFDTFRGAVAAVTSGAADVALLPVENTTAGGVSDTYDLLGEGNVTINAEVVSLIEHCLLAMPGVVLEDVRIVLSHPQALAQCEEYLAARPWLAARAEFDTAGSARRVRDANDRTLAAIASESAGRVYGLAVLARGIQTQRGNYTRFVEIAREAAPVADGVLCKTSLLLVLSDHPGALGEVLARFSARGVNLTRIESRPLPGTPWQYRFFLDLEGHAASAPVSAAIGDVRPLTVDLRVLGTYPKADAATGG